MEIKNYFAQDAQGNIMPSANCYLYLPGTTTLATGLVDGNGVPISNPFLASSIGQVTFGAPNGVYDLRISQGARDTTIEIQCADLLQALNETASFLGARSTDPTTRVDGTPLQLADRYLNTTDQIEYIYKASGWIANNLDGQIISSNLGASYVGSVMPDGSNGTVQDYINQGDKKLRLELLSSDGSAQIGFLFPGGEAQSLFKRLTSEVFVEDFGAVGDGVTNDTISISNAITHICTSGGRLQFKAGKIYRCDPLNIVLESYQVAYMQGNGAVILSTNPGTTVQSLLIRAKFGSSIRVERIYLDHVTQPSYLDGNGVAETGGITINPFSISEYPDLVEIDGVKIKSAWWAGIRVYLPRVARVTNCSVQNAKGSGIFGSVRETAFVSGNEVFHTSDDCIFFGSPITLPAKSFVASGNVVGSNGSKGIGAAGFKYNSFVGNLTDNTSAFGLVAYSGSEASDVWGPIDTVAFTGNTVGRVLGAINNVAGTKAGIYVRGDATRQPRLVTMTGNNIKDTGEQLIRIDTALLATLVGNSAEGGTGLLVGGAAGYGTTQLQMSANNFNVTSANAIALFDVSKFAIRDNQLRGYTAAPIAGVRCADGEIYDNTLAGSSQAPSFPAGNTNVKFSDFKYAVSAYVSGTSSADTDNPIAMHRSLQKAPNNANSTVISIMGDVVLTGTLTAAQGIMNLGTALQPLATQNIPVSCFNGTTYTMCNLQIRNSSNGLCVLYGAPAGTTKMSISTRFKLD